MPKEPKTPLTDAKKLSGMDTYILIAVAVLKDNNSMDMSTDTMKKWLNFAKNITSLMLTQDEPRFTLYDYLDACLNSSRTQWHTYANIAQTAINHNDSMEKDSAFDIIMRTAEYKREVYGG